MKAARIYGAGRIAVENVEVTEPGPDEVLIRVLGTGICGTDVEIADGIMPYFVNGMSRYPVVPGHEWVGEVVRWGAGVSGFAAGDRVVGECSVGCGRCAVCLSGNYHRCADRSETGILRRDGAFAEYITFPALYLHRISNDVDLRAAALVEPTAVAFNGVRMAGVSPRDEVVIFGDGPIGLLLLQVARAFGAARVTVVGATAHRLERATALGADAVVDVSREDPVEHLQRTRNGQGPQVALEATGNPAAAAAAIRSVAEGGRVILQGVFAGRTLDGFDLDQIVLRDLTVKGALGSPGIWPEVIALIESGRVRPEAIVSHVVPLEDFARGIAQARDRLGIKQVVLQDGSAGQT